MAAFGCDSGVPGDPKLPDGWDQDKLVTCVRRTERGKAKMPEMLMKLGIAKDLSVGLKLSHSKGTALANSLKGADGERQTRQSLAATGYRRPNHRPANTGLTVGCLLGSPPK